MKKITQCEGQGQYYCKRCMDHGRWNRMWMCFLYKVEGKEGCYCKECREIVANEENETDH